MTFFKIILFLIIPYQFFGQTIPGKVIDADNFNGIAEVHIINENETFSTLSDAQGWFEIPKPGTYTFIKEGFLSRTIQISKDKFIWITLTVIPENLEEIVITASNFQSKLKAFDGAISQIPVKEIKSNSSINFTPILNTVPGVFMQSGTLNTNKITIRGIGSRNLFGTSKIRAYYQEIPLTNGSGESTIEDLEINALGRVEILKGPSSSRFGAGLGGSIHLIPHKGILEENSFSGEATFGSFGLQKYLLQASLGNQSNSANIIYSNTQSDGYRENNAFDRKIISLATNHFLGKNNKISIIGNYIDLKAFIPSSIDEKTYQNNPESAAVAWKNAKGYEAYKKGLFGLTWQHDYNSKSTQYTSLFTSFIDSYEPRPFNILQDKTNAIGLRTRFASTNIIFDNLFKWTIGTEIFNDKNSYQTLANLYQSFPPGTGSVAGDLLSDFEEKRIYLNIFFDSEYVLFENMKFTFGLNFNQTSYDLKDKSIATETDFSGDYSFEAIFSPKLGLVYEFSENSMIYTVLSHGFSPPTLQETLLPGGSINTNIKPETGWNYEIGTRGEIFSDKLFYDAAVYRMNVENLLVARRTGDDEFIGVNAGETSHTGLELALNYKLVQLEKIGLTTLNSVTFNDFKFEDFVELEQDFSGNQLPGVPKFTFNSRLNLETNIGLYAFLTYNYVGEIAMRDDNTKYADKYQLIHTKLGYKILLNKNFQLDVYFGINNLFDEKYASMLLINATGFGSSAPRYYYPAEPINYYSGINLKYTL